MVVFDAQFATAFEELDFFFFPPLNASESFTHEGQSVANMLLSFVPPLCCTFCFIFLNENASWD